MLNEYWEAGYTINAVTMTPATLIALSADLSVKPGWAYDTIRAGIPAMVMGYPIAIVYDDSLDGEVFIAIITR